MHYYFLGSSGFACSFTDPSGLSSSHMSNNFILLCYTYKDNTLFAFLIPVIICRIDDQAALTDHRYTEYMGLIFLAAGCKQYGGSHKYITLGWPLLTITLYIINNVIK